MSEEQAFLDGVQARQEGKSTDDNPHTDDELHFAWFAGFMCGVS